ncbi:PREDICTED: synembryn-A-like [Rhagoletis zephyria]|uniref:synembryn-A-like n=1 Tax=Rhagoletis zephyria TaxID=28612 RepID=UPI0008119EC1|nr:PREDICTED: synembryn-A-like [Rhagoletis zephyria]KAH9409698.1 Synembryn-B [Tyrophagus putrescentiae]
MDNLLQILRVGSQEQVAKELASFYTNFSTVTLVKGEFTGKQAIMEELFRLVRDPDMANLCPLALQVMRVFTREPAIAETQFNSDRIETLLHLAMLVGEEEAFMTENSQSFDVKIVVEAQKCLTNLLSLSAKVRRICSNNSCVEGIMLRLRIHPDPKLPQEVKYFDMVALFLLTALCSELRGKVQNNYHGLIYLMEAIDLILKNNAEYLAETVPSKNKRRSKGSRRGRKSAQSTENGDNGKEEASDGRLDDTLVAYCLDDWEANLAIQILKVLYNLNIDLDNREVDEVEEAHFFRLVSILHDLMLCDTKNPAKKEDLQSQVVNLLTLMPIKSYEELLSNVADLGKPENPEHEYNEMNMEVIAVLCKFLEKRLQEETASSSPERLLGILGVMYKASKSCSTTRKFLRYRILPPLREADLQQRPEVGNLPRNRLVRLMASSNDTISQLAINFIWSLCKSNRNRFVKYVGYGNAAGHLARIGRMAGEMPATYSSDSDDSETDEYVQNVDRINPVTGHIQELAPNPMEGMSEEQKEYEANQLVNLIDQMQRTGIIQPCRIGEDGRPVPIEHVLELQSNAEINNGPSTSGLQRHNSDSD